MKLLSDKDGVITLSELLPLDTTTPLIAGNHVSTTYQTLSLFKIIAPTIQLWYIELTAHNHDTITVSNENIKGIVLQVALKNTFKTDTGILYERQFNVVYYPDSRFSFQVEKTKTYKLALLYIPLQLFQQAKEHFSQLHNFINAVVHEKKTKLHDRNLIASTLLLLHLIEIRYCPTVNQLEQFTWRIVTTAFDLGGDPPPKPKRITAKQLEQLYRLTSYINNNYQRQYSVSEFIQAAECSEHTVKKFFTSFYGIVPNDYIHEQRVLTAIRLLLTTKIKITYIAYEIGYIDNKGLPNTNTFKRVFEKFIGVLPSHYRKQKSDISG